jgi:OmpA-OmpF porin, OOP family
MNFLHKAMEMFFLLVKLPQKSVHAAMRSPMRIPFIPGMFFMLLLFVAVFGRTIRVPQKFPDLHIASREADVGDTILLDTGVHVSSVVVLPDNVTLAGSGMAETVLRHRGGGPSIIAADGSMIRDLTIQGGSVGVLSKSDIKVAIRHTIIRDCRYAGVHTFKKIPLIENCSFINNGIAGVYLEHVDGRRFPISNNVFVANGYCGVYCADTTTVLIRNNIFVDNRRFAIFADREADSVQAACNIVWNTHTPRFLRPLPWTPNVMVESGITTYRPEFVSPGPPRYDYRVVAPTVCAFGDTRPVAIGLTNDNETVSRVVDRDGDGIVDGIDRCINVPEDLDGFADEDGCPDYDNDKDGIPDSVDKCPNVPEDFDGFADADGCPDPDNDNDGINDALDSCPNAPETVNGFKDSDGCPDRIPDKPRSVIVVPASVFEKGTANLLRQSSTHSFLDSLADTFLYYKDLAMHIVAGDSATWLKGSDRWLIARRARSVYSYLIVCGVDTKRLVLTRAKGLDGKPSPEAAPVRVEIRGLE